jgi:hypothetical protein
MPTVEIYIQVYPAMKGGVTAEASRGSRSPPIGTRAAAPPPRGLVVDLSRDASTGTRGERI